MCPGDAVYRLHLYTVINIKLALPHALKAWGGSCLYLLFPDTVAQKFLYFLY